MGMDAHAVAVIEMIGWMEIGMLFEVHANNDIFPFYVMQTEV
jgi:hypothetical protein